MPLQELELIAEIRKIPLSIKSFVHELPIIHFFEWPTNERPGGRPGMDKRRVMGR